MSYKAFVYVKERERERKKEKEVYNSQKKNTKPL